MIVVVVEILAVNTIVIVVVVHGPFSRRANDGAADRADHGADWPTGQADNTTGDGTRRGSASSSGVILAVVNSRVSRVVRLVSSAQFVSIVHASLLLLVMN
jgi:hypothetical protein